MTPQETLAALDELAAHGAPLTPAELNRRISAIAEIVGVPVRRMTHLLGSVIIAQMLPGDAIVKGGVGVKIRLGESGTRATSDLDLATADQQATTHELRERLQHGWGHVPPSNSQRRANPDAPDRTAFVGDLKPLTPAQPQGIAQHYVMAPHQASLYFLTPRNSFASVLVEIGIDEFEGSMRATPQAVIDEQVAAAVKALGCGTPNPVTVISPEQQIAQKIHAATDPNENRGHDLIDIQLLWHAAQTSTHPIDTALLAELCRTTFAYRSPSRSHRDQQPHTWPPDLSHMERLDRSYTTALAETTAGNTAPPEYLSPTITQAQQWLAHVIALLEEH